MYFAFFAIVMGILLISLSIPLVMEKIKPNPFYGFRTPKTLSDERVWYKANKYMGKAFIWTYSVVIVLALLLLPFEDVLSELISAIVGGILFVVPPFIALALSFSYLGKLEVSPETMIDMKEAYRQENKVFDYVGVGLAVLLLMVGLLMSGLSIPLILDKVEPNGFYGVRIEKTLNNEAIWYQANKFCGYTLLIAGVAQSMIAVGLVWFRKRIRNWVSLVISIATLHLPILATVATLIYTVKL